MGRFHDNRFPGEGEDYRAARDELLDAEIELRRQHAAVVALRAKLPPGGKLKEDYVFEEADAGGAVRRTRFSELFAPGKDSLIVYGLMYAPDQAAACPMCAAMLDSLDGTVIHARDRVNLAVVAKAPVAKLVDLAAGRGWRNLRLLSSGATSYNGDYFAETPDGEQLPSMNVFRRTPDGIFHSYNSELFFAPPEDGQHPRHIDQIWPLWNLFDLTPEGRGTDWFPKLSYD